VKQVLPYTKECLAAVLMWREEQLRGPVSVVLEGEPFVIRGMAETESQHTCLTAETKFIIWFGGYRCGKTEGLSGFVLRHMRDNPGARWLIARQAFTDLRDSTMRTFFSSSLGGMCPKEWVGSWKAQERTLTLKNGSEVMFRHLEDVTGLGSMEFAGAWIDEAAEVPEEIATMLTTRLTQANMKSWPFCISTNYFGHNWVWRWAYGPEKKSPTTIIETSMLENRGNLPAEYIEQMLAMPEGWQRRHVYGSHEAWEGQVYDMWSEHNVCDPFPIPPGWARYRAIDPGIGTDTGCVWAAVDPQGVVYVYRYYRAVAATVKEHAAAIRGLSGGEPITMTVMDPNMGADHTADSGKSIQALYSAAGVTAVLGNDNLDLGIAKVQQAVHQQTLKVFRGLCEGVIEDLISYPWDVKRLEKTGQAKPAQGKWHLADCVRYLLMADPSPAMGIVRQRSYVDRRGVGATGY